MTRVSFYILQPEADAELWVCRLLDKALRAGTRSHVCCTDDNALSSLDQRLWTFSQGSFSAHDIVAGGEESPAPIILTGTAPGQGERQNILLWHCPDKEPPAWFSSFERCLEIVGGSETLREAARARYRFYRDRGYPMDTHEIN